MTSLNNRVASLLAFRSNTNLPTRLRSSTLVDKDKEEVTEYFNNNGFDRWNKIYSESEEVNNVQLDIRTGHGQTIEKVCTYVYFDFTSVARPNGDAGSAIQLLRHHACTFTGYIDCCREGHTINYICN